MQNIMKGSTSRRGILQAGLAVFATSMTAGAAMAQDAEKLAQAIVQYQTMPKDGAKCSTCVNFEPPNACKIVVSPINPEGWCVAYAPKGG